MKLRNINYKLKGFFSEIDYTKWAMALSIFFVAACFRLLVPSDPKTGLVFDEAYFLPQAESYVVNRYYHDPHPPVGKLILYYGIRLLDPNAVTKIDPEKLANKVDNYIPPIDMNSIRFFPKVFGSLVPVVIYLIVFELVAWRRKRRSLAGYLIPFLAGLLIAFDNSMIVESRYALLNQFMLFFMFGSVLISIWYYRAKARWKQVALFLLLGIFVGLSVGTKWLALSVVPVIALLVWLKDFKGLRFKAVWKKAIAATLNVLIIAYIAFGVYFLVYAVHFSKLQHWSPAAGEVSQSFQSDLLNGTSNTSLWQKFIEVQYLNAHYQSGVPELDYAKGDEIGSMWITWPIMARPINYYQISSGDDRSFIYLFGNPATWFLGLAGVIVLGAMCLARLFGKNQATKVHFLVLFLFICNWLPFSLITRVMYLYHYFPALMVSAIAFGLVMHDFVLPRLTEITQIGYGYLRKYLAKMKSSLHSASRLKKAGYRLLSKTKALIKRTVQLDLAESVAVGVFLVLTILVVVSFYFFAPLSYLIPMKQPQFEQRVLLKEWNMKWR